MKITTAESENEGARTLTVEYNFGETLKESAQLFTEKVVHNNFVSGARVSLQGLIRRGLKAGKKDAEILAQVKEWKPGMKKPGKSNLEKAEDLWNKMTPEEQKAYIAKFAKK